jgi:hypothetical protein
MANAHQVRRHSHEQRLGAHLGEYREIFRRPHRLLEPMKVQRRKMPAISIAWGTVHAQLTSSIIGMDELPRLAV